MPLCKQIKKVLVIGSGPIVIGQGAEFDYAGTQACLALKEEGIEVILLNNNPATIMTDKTIADKVYIEPLTVASIEEIIKKEKPNGIIGTLGGQTGLNLLVELDKTTILADYNVQVLGTSVQSIRMGEDRDKFRELMLSIHEPIPESYIIHSVSEGKKYAEKIGYPVIIRPAYTLGGEGGGFAENELELIEMVAKGLENSPIHQVLLEKSIKGWKEIEYEVMRDENDTSIIVCNMENFDPVGVHTGDSIVVAPSQTLTDYQYQMLRNVSVKVIRALGIVGGCNIQFALDPHSDNYYIIEVNPRVSRSSALASKATGYPIARMTAKLAVGYHLDEIVNPITGNTFASFEPALDYIVVKLPRFPFDKFPDAEKSLGTQMKATGEVMAIDRSFEGALNKGLRSLEQGIFGLSTTFTKNLSVDHFENYLTEPNDMRLFVIAESFRKGFTVNEIHELTSIDNWFLEKIKLLIDLEAKVLSYSWPNIPSDVLKEAKKKNMSNLYLAELFHVEEKEVREYIQELSLKPSYKQVDTCAGEFEAITPYFYSTYLGMDEVETTTNKKVLVIGSGPIRIGQGVEFDYCSVHAVLALKKRGYETVVINNNPETVSTDFSIADRLYFEPLTVEDILQVIEKEQVEGVLIQFGGQTAINVAESLRDAGVKIFGTAIEGIDMVEDREKFYEFLKNLDIPHIEGKTVHQAGELKQAAQSLGFPVLVRPSYVIGGQSMFIFYKEAELDQYIETLTKEVNSKLWPLLIDQYKPGLECEVDAISDGENIVIPGIMEHIEKAGVHSGDSVSVFPPAFLTAEHKNVITKYTKKIALGLPVIGILNIQFVIDHDTIYVLEVNPRSSRTVPIMSKVTDIPMIDWATAVQLGEKLPILSKQLDLLPEPDFYSVKAPVYSNVKIKGMDFILGPDMKSTGEVLGLGMSFVEAMSKAYLNGKENPLIIKEKPNILISISEREKEEALPIILEIVSQGFQVWSTKGTAAYLADYGIESAIITNKADVIELFKNGTIAAMINTPNQGRQKEKLGYQLRALATQYRVPLFTCLDTVQCLLAIPEKTNIEINAIDHGYLNKQLIHG